MPLLPTSFQFGGFCTFRLFHNGQFTPCSTLFTVSSFSLSSMFNILLVNVVFNFFYHSCWSISFCGSTHNFFSDFLSVKNTVSQSFLGYHSNHVNYPFFHPSLKCKLLLIAFENLHNPYSWVIILDLPSSLLRHHYASFFAFPPLLCFVPCYTIWSNISELIHKVVTLTSASDIFCNTYQKASGSILRILEFYWELVGESAALFFYSGSHKYPLTRSVSLLRHHTSEQHLPQCWCQWNTITTIIITPTQKTSLRTSGIPWVAYWSM